MVKYKNGVTQDIVATQNFHDDSDYGYSTSLLSGVVENRAVAAAVNNANNAIITGAQSVSSVDKGWNGEMHKRADEDRDDGLSDGTISVNAIPAVKEVPSHTKRLLGAGTVVDDSPTQLSLHHGDIMYRGNMGLAETIGFWPSPDWQDPNCRPMLQDFEWTDLCADTFVNVWINGTIFSDSMWKDIILYDSSDEAVYLYADWDNDGLVPGVPTFETEKTASLSETTSGIVNTKIWLETGDGEEIDQRDNWYVHFTPGIYRGYFTGSEIYLLPGQTTVKLLLKCSRNGTTVTRGLITGTSDGMIDCEYYMDNYVRDDLSEVYTGDKICYFKSPIDVTQCSNGVVYRRGANCMNDAANSAYYMGIGAGDTLTTADLNKAFTTTNGCVSGSYHIYHAAGKARGIHVKERLWLS